MGCSCLGAMVSSLIRGRRRKDINSVEHTRSVGSSVSADGSKEKGVLKYVVLNNNRIVYVTHQEPDLITNVSDPRSAQFDMVLSPSPHATEIQDINFTHTDIAHHHDEISIDTNSKAYPQPHRHEAVFSGYNHFSPVQENRNYCYSDYQYCHYPTPVREGIYRLTSDGGHLTSMFSDENPNACIIS